MPTAEPEQTRGRYTPVAQALHWLTLPLVLTVLPLAWVAESLPQGFEKWAVFLVHRSVGLTIFAVVAFRIL